MMTDKIGGMNIDEILVAIDPASINFEDRYGTTTGVNINTIQIPENQMENIRQANTLNAVWGIIKVLFTMTFLLAIIISVTISIVKSIKYGLEKDIELKKEKGIKLRRSWIIVGIIFALIIVWIYIIPIILYKPILI